MHKLAIIDDEYEHVQGIRNYIDWEKYGIEVCGAAYNGKEGLELFIEHHPDIAIIDIQMPFINGLTLMEEVKKLGQNVQMIILSGHDNFDYARRAIELQATHYLLKPCSAEEILQAVLKAKNIAMEEAHKKQIISQYHSIFDQYIALFRERLLLNLLDRKLRNPSTLYEDMRNYGISLAQNPCCVAVFRLEGRDSLYALNTNQEFDCLIISISEEIKKRKWQTGMETIIKEDDIVLIASGEAFSALDFIQYVQRVYSKLSDAFEYPFRVGVGLTVESPLLAFKSYKQALAALENSAFLGEKKVTVFLNEMSQESFHFLYPLAEEKRIFRSIETGDITLTVEAVNHFFKALDRDHVINGYTIKKIGIALLNSLMIFCSEKNIDSTELQTLIFKSFDDIINAKSFECLNNKIIKILEDIMNQIHCHHPVNRMIQKSLSFIHAHYSEDISLKTLADELYISPSYYSFLFKQEMKTNFIDYLNHYRIMMAKELLKDIRLKNYEIAYKVGFQDDKYFFKLFKKYTGLTASQYRESISL